MIVAKYSSGWVPGSFVFFFGHNEVFVVRLLRILFAQYKVIVTYFTRESY